MPAHLIPGGRRGRRRLRGRLWVEHRDQLGRLGPQHRRATGPHKALQRGNGEPHVAAVPHFGNAGLIWLLLGWLRAPLGKRRQGRAGLFFVCLLPAPLSHSQPDLQVRAGVRSPKNLGWGMQGGAGYMTWSLAGTTRLVRTSICLRLLSTQASSIAHAGFLGPNQEQQHPYLG